MPARVAEDRVDRRGRPRQPDIDQRILLSARQVYGSVGWAAFNFDAVAKHAGVSRDAIYRRHADRESLLLDALSTRVAPVLGSDGSIADRLIAYANAVYDTFVAGDGVANLRVHVDAPSFPELFLAYSERVVEPDVRSVESALKRARLAGELNPDADVTAIVRGILGGIMLHAMLYTAHLGGSAQPDRGRDPAVVRIVRQVLLGSLP
jgi:AcrR family transcriptional regulator